MAKRNQKPADESPMDDREGLETTQNEEASDVGEDSVPDYSRYAEEIEETWNSRHSARRESADESENAESATSSDRSGDSEGDRNDDSPAPPYERGRDRFASYRRDNRRDDDRRDDDRRDDDRRGRYPGNRSYDDRGGDYSQDGYLGRQKETIWNRNPFNDRNRNESRYSRDPRDSRDYRGNYNDRRQDDRGDRPDDRRGGYRQDQGRYRQDGGGYQDRYRQDGGGYRQDDNGGYRQERPYRQERFYRRHFRDSDIRVLRDSDIRDNNAEGTAPNQEGDENRPATPERFQPERFHQDRYRPNFGRRYVNPGYPNEMLDQMEPENAPRGKYGEPLSLAEELASARYRGKEEEPTLAETVTPEELSEVATPETTGEAYFTELQNMTARELVQEARKQDIEEVVGQSRQDLAFRILKEKIKKSGLMYGEGTLEILPEEFGFLRNPEFHYLSCPDDIYISPSQIRRFGLRNGSTVFGQIRPPKEKERYFALLRIEAINQEDPNLLLNKPLFDDLTAMHPNERIMLETPDGDMNTRVVDMIVPVGFGQRGLIVSPPRAGKTILMQKMARSVLTNYPDAYVFMLLIDERPEEVTDMERQVKGPHCEVISSTFDEPASRHIQVSEMVLDKAKRMVEYGKDVVIFLDSMTRLARAWNNECPTSGKTLSGGIDAGALQHPKKFFGSARKVEEGGSLTIIATALVDTGSRMDEVIFEEFKGTGNLEIWLDRSLVDKRIWPAIDISRSGTRREEMILDPEEHKRITILRRILNDMNPPDAMDFLTQKLAKTKNNAEFLMGLNIR